MGSGWEVDGGGMFSSQGVLDAPVDARRRFPDGDPDNASVGEVFVVSIWVSLCSLEGVELMKAKEVDLDWRRWFTCIGWDGRGVGTR